MTDSLETSEDMARPYVPPTPAGPTPSNPIAEAVRLLRETAQEYAAGVSIGDAPDWEHEPDTKAAHDELLRVAGALESMAAPSRAAIDTLAERRRQISVEGWTDAHDDEHTDQSIALAAAWYATPPFTRDALDVNDMSLWPTLLSHKHWKPTPEDRRRELVKAGALILAEIERLDRAAGALHHTDKEPQP